MSLKTEHHGNGIEFNVDSELWECRGLELQAKSLKALKTKIDKVLSVERRMDNLPVLVMGASSYMRDYSVTRGTATLFDTKSRFGGPQVWVNLIKGNEVERKKLGLTSVWIDNAENRALLQAVADQSVIIKAEEEKLRTLTKAAEAASITPLQVAALQKKEEIDE